MNYNYNLHIKKNIVFTAFIMLVLFVGGVQVHALSTKTYTYKKPNSILKIFYFRDNENARTSLFQHPSSIDVLAPQAYSIDGDGVLVGQIDPTILDFVQKHKIKVMPLVTNKSFSKSIAESILNDPSKQDIAINAMVDEAGKNGYWGWQVDFEGMNASYKDQYSLFIKNISRIFKEHDLVLSVAVIAQISSDPADYKKDLWDKVIGVYDYEALAQDVDFISVMSYDAPDSKGPVAPYPWLKKVIDYSLQYIPADKLSLGIPFYYWKWNDTTGKLISVGGNEGIQKMLQKRKVTVGYSKVNEAPFMKYTYKKNHYTLWYENAKSMAKKMNLIKQYKLHGFSAWVLGLELPSVYSTFKEM